MAKDIHETIKPLDETEVDMNDKLLRLLIYLKMIISHEWWLVRYDNDKMSTFKPFFA